MHIARRNAASLTISRRDGRRTCATSTPLAASLSRTSMVAMRCPTRTTCGPKEAKRAAVDGPSEHVCWAPEAALSTERQASASARGLHLCT